MSLSKTNRRRSLVIDKELQKKIVLAVAAFPSLSLALSTLIVAVFCRKLMSEAARIDADLPSLVPLFLAVLGFVIVSAIVVVQQALRFSNRIAGPSYRLIKSMQQVCSGDVSFRVKLRKGDLLGEVADAFNELLDWLNLNPPRGIKTRDLVEVSDAVELPEVCGGKPATRDALLAQQEGDGQPAVAAERAAERAADA